MPTLLEIDRGTLEARFGRESFEIRHNLTEHPLLTVDAIADLADRLPEDHVEHNLGDVPEVLPGGDAPRLDLPAGEIARGIEGNGCWMVLKMIEWDSAYRELVHASLAEVIPHVAHREGGAIREEGYIFLSAPNSTTPSHFDPEHNLLLQIRGPKAFTVGRFPDQKTEAHEVERYYAGGHRNIETMPADAHTYELGPGDGVYVPVHAPHSVRTFDQVSVSLSITFYTRASQREIDVWVVNSKLRKLRFSPARPGTNPVRDRLKASAWGGARRGVRAAKRLSPVA